MEALEKRRASDSDQVFSNLQRPLLNVHSAMARAVGMFAILSSPGNLRVSLGSPVML